MFFVSISRHSCLYDIAYWAVIVAEVKKSHDKHNIVRCFSILSYWDYYITMFSVNKKEQMVEWLVGDWVTLPDCTYVSSLTLLSYNFAYLRYK